jgi:hypothetical protein
MDSAIKKRIIYLMVQRTQTFNKETNQFYATTLTSVKLTIYIDRGLHSHACGIKLEKY